jgi:hypothetical protein
MDYQQHPDKDPYASVDKMIQRWGDDADRAHPGSQRHVACLAQYAAGRKVMKAVREINGTDGAQQAG